MDDETTDGLKPEETTDELTLDELAAQTGAQLPDREAMSVATLYPDPDPVVYVDEIPPPPLQD